MDELKTLMLRITGDNDQDRAACETWWAETTASEKFAVWQVIVKKYDDPAMEVMSRFAQLMFCEMVEKHGLTKKA